MVEAIRPRTSASPGAYWVTPASPVPEDLMSFTRLGLREGTTLDETLQQASEIWSKLATEAGNRHLKPAEREHHIMPTGRAGRAAETVEGRRHR